MLYLFVKSLEALVKEIKKTPGRALFVVLLCVAIAFGVHRYRRVVPVAQTVAPGVTSTVVETQSLSTKDVVRVVSDPKDKALIARLLSQLAALKAAPTSVVVSTAHSESTGGGRIVVDAPPEVVVTLTAPEPSAPAPTSMRFKDYRLTFEADLVKRQATYALSQQFETVVTTGRQRDGRPLALAAIYEIGENGDRTLMPTTSTTAVFADETSPHWMRQVGIMGGVAATRDAEGRSANGAVIALQWLTRGRTKAAEDSTLALLSPALVLAKGATDIGILPVSVNVGRIPHQPLSNVWVSPYISKSQRIGVMVSAKF
jgi:hypothetical protein